MRPDPVTFDPWVFRAPAHWLEEPVRVLLAGVGGNGSEMLDALGRLHLSLKAMGHPYGLEVTAIDPDTVSSSNIVRQRFFPAEIGCPKAMTAIQRMNLYLGLQWKAYTGTFEDYIAEQGIFDCHLIIGCVDSVSGRNSIEQLREYESSDGDMPLLYLDLGNGEHSGQIVLGHLWAEYDAPLRLPIVQDLFPEIRQETVEDDAPSCSAEESLQRQGFGINRTMATLATNLLWNLMTRPGIDHHGFFVDTQRGSVQPLKIDPNVWLSFGYEVAA